MFLAALTTMGDSGVSPDAALVHRLLQRDVRAFEELYDRHSRVVFGLVLRILQQAGTAEEVVQDVFLQLWRNAGRYDEDRGPFVPWLLTLARNSLYSRMAGSCSPSSRWTALSCSRRKNSRWPRSASCCTSA